MYDPMVLSLAVFRSSPIYPTIHHPFVLCLLFSSLCLSFSSFRSLLSFSPHTPIHIPTYTSLHITSISYQTFIFHLSSFIRVHIHPLTLAPSTLALALFVFVSSSASVHFCTALRRFLFLSPLVSSSSSSSLLVFFPTIPFYSPLSHPYSLSLSHSLSTRHCLFFAALIPIVLPLSLSLSTVTDSPFRHSHLIRTFVFPHSLSLSLFSLSLFPSQWCTLAHIIKKPMNED